MRKQIVLKPSSSAVGRRQPLLEKSDRSKSLPPMHRRKASMGELAGGTAADCTAIACCCPCGLVKFVFLAVYKVPTGLCRKALRKKHHRRLKSDGGFSPRGCSCNDEFLELHPLSSHLSIISAVESAPNDNDVIELEREMWDKFYATGFWRSPSQRSEVSGLSIVNQF